MAGWLDGWMPGWLDAWMAGWLDGWMAGWLDAAFKRVLQYGVRSLVSTEIYGSKGEKKKFHKYLQEAFFALTSTEISEDLRKPPGVYGRMLSRNPEFQLPLRMAGRLDGWMAGWLDGWMAGWLDGWMVGWLDIT